MTTIPVRTCPDCKGPTHPIRIIDKTHGEMHADLEFTLPEARQSFWLGRYPVAGRVTAYMCGECGRVLLYGENKESDDS